RSQAAKFLVALAGIQEMVHEFVVCLNRISFVRNMNSYNEGQQVSSGGTAVILHYQPVMYGNWRKRSYNLFASPVIGRHKRQKKEDSFKISRDFYLRCSICSLAIVERETAVLLKHLDVYRVDEFGGVTVTLAEQRLIMHRVFVGSSLLCSFCRLGLGYVPFNLVTRQMGPYYFFTSRII
ncbi:hypothetical protein MKW98_026185, partial [Papaver atlanticum]